MQSRANAAICSKKYGGLAVLQRRRIFFARFAHCPAFRFGASRNIGRIISGYFSGSFIYLAASSGRFRNVKVRCLWIMERAENNDDILQGFHLRPDL
jgi:hypothetical protein